MEKHMQIRFRKTGKKIFKNFLRWFILFLFLFPLFWTILSSFKTQTDLFAMPPKFIFSPTLDAYREIFHMERFRGYMLNSVIISTVTVAIAMILGTSAAYALCRFNFKGKKDLSFWIISTRMAPPVVAIVPFFLLARNLGIYDTRLALIIIYLTFNIPFATWMMMGYFSQVPIDLDEAAMLDGCNRFNLLGRVLLPLVMPGFLATAVICFIYSWNEFFFAYVLTGRNAPTIPVGIAAFITQHGVHWDQVTATGTLIMLPILVFGVIIQRYFVRGLIEGALAGQ
jgi:multiple sugar transport system permease protein